MFRRRIQVRIWQWNRIFETIIPFLVKKISPFESSPTLSSPNSKQEKQMLLSFWLCHCRCHHHLSPLLKIIYLFIETRVKTITYYQNNMCLSKKIIIPRMQRILDPCIFFWLHLFFRMKQLRSFLKSGLESLNSSFWLNGISSIQHASWQLFFFLTSSYPSGQRLVALSAASA